PGRTTAAPTPAAGRGEPVGEPARGQGHLGARGAVVPPGPAAERGRPGRSEGVTGAPGRHREPRHQRTRARRPHRTRRRPERAPRRRPGGWRRTGPLGPTRRGGSPVRRAGDGYAATTGAGGRGAGPVAQRAVTAG